MERHAAFPDLEDVERVGKIPVRLVEQYVAEAPTENHAEHAVEKHVVEVAAGPAFGRDVRLARAQAAEPQEHDERRQIHQAVPADGERPQMQGDGIELRMDEHESCGFQVWLRSCSLATASALATNHGSTGEAASRRHTSPVSMIGLGAASSR